jgi:hypothetical protein
MKKRLLFIFLGILVAVGVINAVANINEATPMSADGMTVEERAQNDVEVLTAELADFDVESIEINYDKDAIKVYISRPSTEQFVDEHASDIESAINLALEDRKADLTLEKESYNIFVYSEDGSLIN